MSSSLSSAKLNVPYSTTETIERPRLYDFFRENEQKGLLSFARQQATAKQHC